MTPDLTTQKSVLSRIRDVSPIELGDALMQIRSTLTKRGFRELVLSPFDAYTIDYPNEVVDVPELGQLRFNTEPEIWQAIDVTTRFFSATHLFRRERSLNCLRRSAFLVIDFYLRGSPNDLMPVFSQVLQDLAFVGFAKRLSQLPIEATTYDARHDAPALTTASPRWALARGYDADNSFFEVDAHGRSTRMELFLVTPRGYLEIGALGIVGKNKNSRYTFRAESQSHPSPPEGLSGMGFGLERLLLAERILSSF